MLKQQIGQFLQMLFLGWSLLFCVGVVKKTATFYQLSYRQQQVEDFCLCLFCSALFFVYLLGISGGLLRGYHLIGLLSGCILYRIMCCSWIKIVEQCIACFLHWILHWMQIVAMFPWQIVCFLFFPVRRWLKKQEKKMALEEEKNDENENIFLT